MAHTMLMAAIALLAAVLAVAPCHALAIRHVLGSSNALNVRGRRYDTEDGGMPPAPEREPDLRFHTMAAYTWHWLSSRLSASRREEFDAATAAEEEAYLKETERVVGIRWWEGRPLMTLVRHDCGRTREALALAAAAGLSAGAAVLASPFLSGLQGWQAWPYAALWGVLSAALAVAALADWRHYVLPHATNLLISACALAMAFLRSGGTGESVWLYLGTGIGIFLLFAGFEFFGKSGGGDTKIIVGLGFLLGPWIMFSLLYASLLSLLYKFAIARFVERHKETPNTGKETFMKQKVPYGPFLASGLLVAMLTFPLNALIFQAYTGLLFAA